MESFVLKDSQVCLRLHVKFREGHSGRVKEMYMDRHRDALDVLRGTCSLKINLVERQRDRRLSPQLTVATVIWC